VCVGGWVRTFAHSIPNLSIISRMFFTAAGLTLKTATRRTAKHVARSARLPGVAFQAHAISGARNAHHITKIELPAGLTVPIDARTFLFIVNRVACLLSLSHSRQRPHSSKSKNSTPCKPGNARQCRNAVCKNRCRPTRTEHSRHACLKGLHRATAPPRPERTWS
jgi:hypothetical protein